jgi:uncharacterized protein (DUF697 family)
MARRRKPGALAALSLLREARIGHGDHRPLAVAGARELVPVLARALREGGEPGAVVEGAIEGAAVVVWVGPADEAELRRADRLRIPVIAVSDEPELPYVLATDLVRVPPGRGFPVEEIAAAVARRLGERGTALAARLPVLRRPLAEHLIARAARRNALVAAAVFMPGADLPLLTLNEARLVLRLALAHGRPADGHRFPELAGVAAAGFGLRAAAREVLATVPVAGWALKAGVAYTGTKAVGEAALRLYEAQA